MGIFNRKSSNSPQDKKQVDTSKQVSANPQKEVKVASEKKSSSAVELTKKGKAAQVLLRPVITEKATLLGSENKYVFAVAPKANKIEIAKAIEVIYGVRPVSINIIKVKGKKVRYGRIQGRRKDWKKAIITLPTGKTLNVYEGV
ncbi:50S ribosomal protein L23 [Candidatus Parcubacteria bacterium]|nr:MAG: 50S ribosomal protein L23 [Candidatus Parcubacteria bacterium]